MSKGEKSQAHRSLGIGDHTPIFSSPDCEGGLFDLYSDVKGQPTVMVFLGDECLKKNSEKIAAAVDFDAEQAQIVTFVNGTPEQVLDIKQAADWPHQTVADAAGDITTALAAMSDVQVPSVYVLDPNQRIVGMISLDAIGDNLTSWIKEHVRGAAHDSTEEMISRAAPVLIIPRVLEPQDCDWLIGLWRDGEKHQGQVALGSTATETHGVNAAFKRREDYVVNDIETYNRIINRLMPRMVPEISKIYHYENWKIEAFRIGCYKAEDQGFFHVHRDDCNPSVKHRKFAVTINLNSGAYEGGDLRFPEYGNELYQPPAGGAIVFSCSMLHEVMPVTAGERYVLLTFLTE